MSSMKFNISKLQYAYSSTGIVNISKANKQDNYFLDNKLTIPLVYCKGSVNVGYWRKKSNISELDLIRVFGNSESIEHYNKKMEIAEILSIEGSFGVKNKFKYIAHSSKVEYYIKEINKIVDVAFFDKDGDVLIYIEVFYKNKKTQEDIDKFNKLNVVVYEYDIQKERCYAISAGISYPKEYSENRKRVVKGRGYIQKQREEINKFKKITEEYYEVKNRKQNLSARLRSKEEQIQYLAIRVNKLREKIKSVRHLEYTQLNLKGTTWEDVINK